MLNDNSDADFLSHDINLLQDHPGLGDEPNDFNNTQGTKLSADGVLKDLQDKIEREEDIDPYEGFTKPLNSVKFNNEGNFIPSKLGLYNSSDDEEEHEEEQTSKSIALKQAKSSMEFLAADASLSSESPRSMEQVFKNQRAEIEQIMLCQLQSSV